MDTLYDIDMKSNIFYNANKKIFENVIPEELEFQTIIEPIIVMDGLHSCFSHAILDYCFPIFWIIDDLLKAGKIADANIRIFVRGAHPSQSLQMNDEGVTTYKGVYNDIIKLITPFSVYFQHTLKKNYVFKTCFFYPTNYPVNNDRWQRTPWNCVDYYPQRNVPKAEIRFSDDIIYEKLSLFRNAVFIKTCTGIDASTNNLMIIDRNDHLKIDRPKLQSLVKEAQKNRGWNFTGVVSLEDKTLKEQVALFANHRIFICRHGSSEINLLWIPNNSIVIELGGRKQRPCILKPMIYNRICKLTNSKHIVLNYFNYDYKKDIFDTLIL